MSRPEIIKAAEMLLDDLESWGKTDVEWQKVWNAMREEYELDKKEGNGPDWPSIMYSALYQIVYPEMYEDVEN